MTDAEWEILQPEVEEVMAQIRLATGRPMDHPLRPMLDAVRYLVRNGIEWRAMPIDFPFRVGGQMDRVFNTVVDRTRSRLDVPTLRTMFGAKKRPGVNGTPDLSPKLAVVIETPRWDLTLFKVHFGLLTLKGYTKGERVLRFEAVAHNTKQLGCGRTLDKFPTIVARLAGMVERFTTLLDCVDIGFIPDATLDELPQPSQIGATRVGGVDLNKPRIRTALAAVLALAAAPDGFTVADLAAKVHAIGLCGCS